MKITGILATSVVTALALGPGYSATPPALTPATICLERTAFPLVLFSKGISRTINCFNFVEVVFEPLGVEPGPTSLGHPIADLVDDRVDRRRGRRRVHGATSVPDGVCRAATNCSNHRR